MRATKYYTFVVAMNIEFPTVCTYSSFIDEPNRAMLPCWPQSSDELIFTMFLKPRRENQPKRGIKSVQTLPSPIMSVRASPPVPGRHATSARSASAAGTARTHGHSQPIPPPTTNPPDPPVHGLHGNHSPHVSLLHETQTGSPTVSGVNPPSRSIPVSDLTSPSSTRAPSFKPKP